MGLGRMVWNTCLAGCPHGSWCISCRVMHHTGNAPDAFSAVSPVGSAGKKRLLSLGRISVRPADRVFIEKPCNTASHYKSYGIFSTLFSSTADHTIPVLDMAAAAAVPSGILIWFLGSMAYAGPETGYGALLYSDIAGGNLLAAIIHFLEHPARLLDWTAPYWLLLSWVFFPWNGASRHDDDISENRRRPFPSSPFILGQVLASHGWTWRTALCTCLMALTRFPSITVCLKMRRRPGHTPYFFGGGCWYSFSVSPCAFS